MNNVTEFIDVRLFYTKTGSAKYISHLDVMRAFQRALKRSKIDFWYTEGFHPHLYLTFALPLSLGYESVAESVDFRLVSPMPYEEVVHRINKVLPVGFKAIAAGKPKMDAKQIRFADYQISFEAEGKDIEETLGQWYRCFDKEYVPVIKKTKSGEKEIDIKPHIKLSKLEYKEGRYCLKARLASGVELNINPDLVFAAFRNFAGFAPDDIKVKRMAVYNEKMEKFR